VSFGIVSRRRTDPLNPITVSEVNSILAQKVNEDHYAHETVQLTLHHCARSFGVPRSAIGVQAGIAGSIMAPRVFPHESLPFAPAWADVQKILAVTAGNHQPFAITLL
jgi:hypothetical protein